MFNISRMFNFTLVNFFVLSFIALIDVKASSVFLEPSKKKFNLTFLNSPAPINIHQKNKQYFLIINILNFNDIRDRELEFFENKNDLKKGSVSKDIFYTALKEFKKIPLLRPVDVERLKVRLELLKGDIIEYKIKENLASVTKLFPEVYSSVDVPFEVKDIDNKLRGHYEDSNWRFFNNVPENSLLERARGIINGHAINDCSYLDKNYFLNNSIKPYTAKLHDRNYWHEYFLKNGPSNTSDLFRFVSLLQNNSCNFQMLFDEYQQSNYSFETDLLRDLNIALIPDYSYELKESMIEFNTTLASSLRLGGPVEAVEGTSYVELKEQLMQFGASKVEVVERNSGASLDLQAKQTLKYLKKKFKNKPFIIISNSSGSHVINYLKKTHKLPRNVQAWLNVGGTPRGSVVSYLKSTPQVFYTSMLKPFFDKEVNSLSFKSLELNKSMATYNVLEFFREAYVRSNMETLSFEQPITLFDKSELSSQLPILNVILLAKSQAEWTDSLADNPKGDALYFSQTLWGPSEGASLLADSSIDSQNSIRVLVNNDHLMFRKLSQDEGLMFYLSILKSARENKMF